MGTWVRLILHCKTSLKIQIKDTGAEVAQWIKELANKSGDVNFIPGTHMGRKKAKSCKPSL